MASLYEKIRTRLSEMGDDELEAALDRVDAKMRASYDASAVASHVVGGATDLLPSLLLDGRIMQISGVAAYFGQATHEYLQRSLSGGYFEEGHRAYSVKQRAREFDSASPVDRSGLLSQAA